MADQWDWWRAALEGKIGPVREAEPQSGFFRHYIGTPVAIWRDGDVLTVLLDGDVVEGRPQQCKVWLQVAKGAVSKAAYDARVASGEWPSDAPEIAPPASVKAEVAEAATETSASERTVGPGDNSGDLDEYTRMRTEVLGDVAEARAYYARNKIENKDAADRAMDWSTRLVKAAREADKARLRENEPLRKQIAENDAKWKAISDEAAVVGRHLESLATEWGRAEAARLQKEAADRARAEQERLREEARKQREAAEAAERERRAEAGGDHDADGVVLADPPQDDPEPMLLPPVVVEAPKVMLGSGRAGNRRGVTADSGTRKVPVITDLEAAAKFLAETRNKDLIDLVLRVGGKVAKAGGTFPGVAMRDEEAA